ncbi:MAG: 1-deoxy-D-xylulose-5-phosphate reductoisomerase [Ruminococcaceae bacterium]|nr:1-deoxy-D-xylulose-5-phosphate reductoisomerase [Oscillospiraceae bacterium]
MVKTVSILGSTGSIGTQTLDVLRNLKKQNIEVKVVALAAGRNVELIEAQAREFMPGLVSVESPDAAKILKEKLAPLGIEVAYGEQGLMDVATSDCEILVTAIVGMKGLLPTLAAIEKGTDIALANKETMVVAGEIVTEAANAKGVKILPVDSEHSAILQCLTGYNHGEVQHLILTASGGPFRTWEADKIKDVSIKDVLAHPTWKMGGKITVDCAGMMNKGLEIIEARWLFDMPYEKIKVLVHPQSIVHSMVQYIDGAVIAQMGVPDMKVPIQWALSYPERVNSDFGRHDFTKTPLTFEEPDEVKFPCLRLAREAAITGGTMTAVMNGANEIAVEKFLKGEIKFMDIPYIVEKAMNAHTVKYNPTVEDVIEADRMARRTV